MIPVSRYSHGAVHFNFSSRSLILARWDLKDFSSISKFLIPLGFLLLLSLLGGTSKPAFIGTKTLEGGWLL